MAKSEFPVTTDKLIDILNEAVISMQKNLDKDKTNNSGNLRQALGDNLNQKVLVKKGRVYAKIEAKGADYWGAVDLGRRPGKQPPLEDILSWVKTKLRRSDISDKNLAFLIARKIGEKGTKGNKFKTNVITNKWRSNLNKQLTTAMAKDISNKLLDNGN